jgi:hypothetical protein
MDISMIFQVLNITFNWSIIFAIYIILFYWFIRNCNFSSFQYHLVIFPNTILPIVCGNYLLIDLVLLLVVFIYVFEYIS